MRSTFLFRLAILLSASGCSILLTRGPSSDTTAPAAGQPMAPAPSCTTSMTWPAVDGVVAAVLTLALISSISQDSNSMTGDDPDGDALASGFIIAGAAGVGALIGHSRVSRCRKVTESYTASYYGAPQPGYPQQPQYGGYPQQYPAQPQYQYPPQPGYPQQQQPGYPAPQPGYPAPQQYPTQPQQPYTPAAPAVAPTAPPSRQPPPIAKQPAPQPPVAKQPPAPKAPPAAAKAPPKAPDPVLGTEGDVCTTQAECAGGHTCTGNVCLKSK
jgi:hypothetical protein